MTTPDVAMVLAAGFGSRMGALTENTPKPLLPVGDATLLDHTLSRCVEGGVRRVVVNLHYRGDQIRRHLAGRAEPVVEFSEEAEILETGGGVRQALPLLGDEPFYTMNSDAIWTGDAPLPALAAAWDVARMGALLLLAPRARALGYTRAGDFFLGEDGRLSRRGGAALADFVYTGAQIIAPEAFEKAPAGAFSTNVIWDDLIAAGRLFGVVHDGDWVDVGTPEGLALAAEASR